MFWLVICLTAVGAAWFFTKQKPHTPAEKPKPPRKPKADAIWGKRIAVSGKGMPCQAVMPLSGQCFEADKVPALPLATCTCKANCLCHYESVSDKRTQPERRSGGERRPALRYDLNATQRRSGQDRRHRNRDPFNSESLGKGI